jgi:hypothetical protein
VQWHSNHNLDLALAAVGEEAADEIKVGATAAQSLVEGLSF